MGVRRDREAARTYRWTILAVGVVSTAALSAVQQGIPAVGPAVREFFDLSLPEVGLVLARATGACGACRSAPRRSSAPR